MPWKWRLGPGLLVEVSGPIESRLSKSCRPFPKAAAEPWHSIQHERSDEMSKTPKPRSSLSQHFKPLPMKFPNGPDFYWRLHPFFSNSTAILLSSVVASHCDVSKQSSVNREFSPFGPERPSIQPSST